MKLIKTLFFWFIAIVVFFVAFLAALDNQHEVALRFLDWSTPEVAFAWWMLGSFLVGVFFTAIANTWSNTKLRLKARQANKQVTKINQDLDKVKSESSVLEEVN